LRHNDDVPARILAACSLGSAATPTPDDVLDEVLAGVH